MLYLREILKQVQDDNYQTACKVRDKLQQESREKDWIPHQVRR